jgi:hypothetical protein
MDDGIQTATYEWWLIDLYSSYDYQEFEDMRDIMEVNMILDEYDFWETWHRNGDESIMAEEEKLSYDIA